MTTHTVYGNVRGQHQRSFLVERSWMVRSGGNVVGPVSLELIERGLSAGRIPDDAEMAHVDVVEWFPVARYQVPEASQPVPPPPPSFRYPEEPVSIPTQPFLASLFG